MGFYLVKALITLAVCLAVSALLVLILFLANHRDAEKTDTVIRKIQKPATGRLKKLEDFLIELMYMSYKENDWRKKKDAKEADLKLRDSDPSPF